MRKKDPAAVILVLLLLMLCASVLAVTVYNRRLEETVSGQADEILRLEEEIKDLEALAQRTEDELVILEKEKAEELEIYGIWLRETEELKQFTGQ
jgi:hypothetical protein